MLTTLFGVRWATLAPLAVYLSSAVTVPAMIWWAAALNQVPLQTAFFLAVGAWVRYLRGRRITWLVWTTCAVLFALLFYVKGVLILPVLGFLAVAYFSSGSPYQRVMTVLRRDWLAGLVAASLIAGYLTYYFTQVEQIFTSTGGSVVAEIADSMLGTAFATGVLGGPWRWSTLSPPTAYADPPGWTNHLAWVVVAAVILYGFLRRERTLRAWVLLAGYLVGLLALLVDSRAPSFGRVIGLEYRYLTDAMCVVALCLGLAFLPLPGATQSSAARTEPLLKVRIPGFVLAAMVVLVSVSGAFSSARYVSYWHSDNASESYFRNLTADLRSHGAVDLVDQLVPEAVMSNLAAPNNTVSRMTSLLSNGVAFPDASARLAVVAPDGTLRQALIGPGVVSQPGPIEDCGWRVSSGGRDVQLTGTAFAWVWWIRVGYLGSKDSPVVVTAGSSTVATTVEAGVNSLYVKVEGGFDSIRIDGLDPGTTVCVDKIEVGQPTPGGALP